MKRFALLLVAMSLSACQENESEQKFDTKPSSITAIMNCYRHEYGADQTVIKMIVDSNKVSGYYVWKPHAQHGAAGEIQGVMDTNGIFKLDYTYTIEGSQQVEEMYFKRGERSLLQGMGELVEQAGKLVAKNPANLDYNRVFTVISCNEADAVLQGN